MDVSKSVNMDKIHKKVIEKLNSEIGSDIKNLHKAKYIIQNTKQKLCDIQTKLELDNDKQSSIIKDAIMKQKESKEAADMELEKIKIFEEKLTKKKSECDEVIEDLSPTLKKIEELQHLAEYLKIVHDIQDINSALLNGLNVKDDVKLVGYYLSLYGGNDSDNSIIGRLEQVEAHYLKSFAHRSAVYWYDILLEKFSKDFQNILKNIKWAQQGQVMEKFSPSKDALHRLGLLTEHLFLIKSPDDNTEILNLITPAIALQNLTTPTKLLIKHFRQRFQYHFTGVRQTNRLDKPEWYFTQILNWAKEYHLFVGKYFQQAVVRAGRENFNIRLEFIRGLVQLAIEKLVADIEDISRDESLFAHLIDETLAFEHDLRESLGYPSTLPSAISVITQPIYLLKWLSIEDRFSTAKMDQMLQSESPWHFIDPDNIEELKIPKCADQFIRLLEAIKDRHCFLTQPGHQLQFLNLQLELIDNFRCRLVQLHSSGNVSSTKILNTINYINSVLRDWGENVHYLHLHAALVGPNADEIDSVFDESIEKLEHWQSQLLKDLSTKIVDEVKSKSIPYRHNNWVSQPEQNSKEPFILSVMAGDMFQIMMSSLHRLEVDLSSNLFATVLRLIAQQLDDFFIDNLVMSSRFSIGGAAQFKYDITRNLFPLFGQYLRRPDLLFKRLNDACILLNIPTGNALLLLETLKENTSIEVKLNALKELGVINVKTGIAVDVLERRTDLRPY